MVISRSVSIEWQDILSSVLENHDLYSFYVNNSKIVIGNGERIQFWWNTWLPNEKLKDIFPRLFNLSEIKDGSLKLLIQNREAAGEWNFSFRRPLRAWEEEDVRRLIEVLNAVPNLRVNADDQIRWTADLYGSFSVSSA